MTLTSDGKYTDFLVGLAPGLLPGNHELNHEIQHFTYFWMIFEARFFDCRFGYQKMANISDQWIENGMDPSVKFASAIDYFRHRYEGDDNSAQRKEWLLGDRAMHEETKDVLDNFLLAESQDGVEVLRALVAIIYRYRNNFFHGRKVDLVPNDQIENFRHANAVLMGLLETINQHPHH